MIKEDKYNIYLDSLDDLNNLKWMIFSNNGSNSDIYKYYKNILLKVFREHLPINEIKYFEELKKINVKNVSIPQKFIILDDKFYGYSMNFMSGKTLFRLTDDINYEIIVASLNKIQETIELFCKNKYDMCDLNLYNILYDSNKNKFNIVDIDYYEKDMNLSFSELYNFNSIRFQKVFLEAITKEFDYIKKSYNLYKELNNILLLGTLDTNSYTTNFMNIKYYLENTYDKEIETLGDLRKILKQNNKYR